MDIKRRFVFLSDKFYQNYPTALYPEIEQKPLRPYIQVVMDINGILYAIPLRSNINHPYVLWTDKPNKCGLDFSKAVVITDPDYIDHGKTPHIRQNEFNSLRGKDYRIMKKMERYIERYRKAKDDIENPINAMMIEKSTLQYFEDIIFRK